MNRMSALLTGVATMAACVAVAAEVTVDFRETTGKVRPALHSSGWTPRSCPRAIQNDDASVKAMNLCYARTHDWALVNAGQRMIDYQFIFPLFHLDARDPKNYYFGPSDHILELCRNVGLKPFYRLGTSIEHTQDVHFNAKVPSDFEKTAEIFAGIMRHYNRGWADGKKWDIEYWEIWNEPDGISNMWCEDGVGWTEENTAMMRDKFIRFYVTCLKRLKSEFPEAKVGGPALCNYLEDFYFKPLLEGCKKAGVAPDFISWHYYGQHPEAMIEQAAKARKLCDGMGFTKTELIIDEWHYILSWDGIHGINSTPAMVSRALDGPTGHNNIDSACFALTALEKFQTSKLDQAHYYGCAHVGPWGYVDGHKQFNKPFFAMKMFGSLMRDYTTICASKSEKDALTPFAVRSADRKKAALLLTDYRGIDQMFTVQVNGAEKAKRVSATVLDHTRDALPVQVEWHDNVLTIVKADKNSAAYLVKFDLED